MENQSLTAGFPTESTRLQEAARYLIEHREECLGRSIPVLKERFGLRNIEAIEATKIAHAIEYGRAV